MLKTVVALLALSLAAPLAAGCAAASAESVDSVGEQALSVASDVALQRELVRALAGLSTGGGEGDPDPYKVTLVDLAPNEAMTEAVLLEKLLPKLIPGADEEAIPGLESKPIAKAWIGVTAEPNPDDYESEEELAAAKEEALKWRGVKQIFDGKLTGVKRFDMGYRAFPEGSLETGAVAHVFVGRSSTGKIFAVWGIDIWT